MQKVANKPNKIKSTAPSLSPEHFLAVVSSILVSNRGALIAYVKRYHELRDSELFVDEVIVSCLQCLYEQCNGGKASVQFESEYAISLLAWVRARIGRPFANTRSGMITNAIRKQRTEDTLFIPLDDARYVNIPSSTEEQSSFDYEKALATTEVVLGRVARDQPKNAFVFRVHLGFHRYAALHRGTLLELAREMRLDKMDCRHVKWIADRLDATEHLGRKALSQDVTGSLVGIHSRQVRSIIAKIRDMIRSSRELSETNVSGRIRKAPALMTRDECRSLAQSATACNHGKLTLKGETLFQ